MTKSVTVTDPESVNTIHKFGTRYQDTDGKLLELDEGGLRHTTYTYQTYDSSLPYPESVGTPDPNSASVEGRLAPLRMKQVFHQNSLFTWRADTFDVFARPKQVYKGSSATIWRTETTEYFDLTSKWVLGQVRTVTSSKTNQPNRVLVSNTYNTTTGLLETVSNFGAFKEKFTYYGDGTINTREDGRLKKTTYATYKRGIPTLVTYHDNSIEKAEVNNIGLVTSVTNQMDAKTTLGYDAVGRLASITHPAPDSVAWNSTTLSFVPVTSSEYGVGPGHWRQIIDTGRGRTVTVFDALWRPVWTRTSDRDRDGATSRAVQKEFDANGRVVFESYPKRDIADVTIRAPGVETGYDALGRMISRSAASELGANVNTTWTYNTNDYTVTETNPRLKATTKAYLAYDDPENAFLFRITAPAGVNVDIVRDELGKPISITRHGGGVAAMRQYVYDSNERLCKTLEPEAAPVVLSYDSAGNVSSRGDDPARTALTCDRTLVSAATKTTFAYDDFNRLTTTTYGDGSQGVTRTYFADGSLKTIESALSVWTYAYNKRGLIESESLKYGTPTYLIKRAYDANGSASSITYPDNAVVSYMPNALGEPMQAGSYATAITFHPNGALQGFSYGNGIQHLTTQNARGLPLKSTDTGVINDTYTYDENANVKKILDGRTGVTPITTRDMEYDDLDRLTKAVSPGIWNQATYTYDALDNLTGTTIQQGATNRISTHVINYAKNQVSQIQSNVPAYNLSLLYNANGNVKQRGVQIFTFDLANRMLSAQGKGTYVYDGHGRRFSVVDAGGLNRYQVYTSDGKFMYAGVTGSPGVKYVYLGRHLIAEVNGVAITYNHTDALGSPVGRTTNTSTAPTMTHYEPYGATAAGFVPTIGFSGHVNAPDIGLVYMQQRFYDPITARFLSVDPVTTDTNTGSSFNRYNYGGNNPYKHIDPDGRSFVHAAAFVIGAGIDIYAQAWGPGGKGFANTKFDFNSAAIAGVTTMITGGVAGKLAMKAVQGVITAKSATLGSAAVGAAMGGAGSAATSLANGKPVDGTKVAISAAGGAGGAWVGGLLDNAGAAAAQRLGNSQGVAGHIGSATQSATNFGSSARLGTSAGQEVGKVTADATAQAAVRYAEERLAR